MLPVTRKGNSSPVLILLHYFGGSGREWTEVISLLYSQYQCISIDIPGFGDAAHLTGYKVEQMSGQIAETIASLPFDNFVPVAHSMSGKISLVLAAQKIPGLRGLALVTPSPPSPEPISAADRRRMLKMRRNRADAEAFLDGLTASPLTGEVRERAIGDFVRCSPDAWSAWLNHGSEEDWAERVGVVHIPTLVITGDRDPSLGVSVQEKLTIPHLSRANVRIISQCGHLPTMEAPDRLASLITDFLRHDLV